MTLAMSGAACTTDDTDSAALEVSTDKVLVYSAEATEEPFTVTSSQPWSIQTDDAGWYSFSATSGTGTQKLTIFIEASEEFDIRTATFTVHAGSLSRTVAIEQNRKVGVEIQQENYEVAAKGGTVEIQVGANIEYEVEIPETAQAWLSVATTKSSRGLTVENLLFRATRNYSGEERSAEIAITSETYGVHETFTVTQLTDGITEASIEGSNCYMLRQNDTKAILVTRANNFWDSADGGFNTANVVGENDEWVVDVIWQDQPDGNLIRFLDADGNEVKQASGTGTEEPFRIRANGAKGNVLIGLHRKGTESVSGNYLWSWHIWITDYNPDACDERPSAGKYIYDVPGGAVHRYAGDEWTGGIYADAFIMDRNLGALKTVWGGKSDPEGVFLYQYGRKDPIPVPQGCFNNTMTGATFYDIDGNPLAEDDPNNTTSLTVADISPKEKTQFDYFYTVQHPAQLIWRRNRYWSTDEQRTGTYLWHSPIPNADTHEKSLYDPCPEGWKLAEISAFADFSVDADNPANGTVTKLDDENFEYAPAKAVFPKYGTMYNNSLNATPKWMFLRTVSYVLTSNSYLLNISESRLSLTDSGYSTSNRYYPVRCVRDTDSERNN